jgi:hypothetical protein
VRPLFELSLTSEKAVYFLLCLNGFWMKHFLSHAERYTRRACNLDF